MKKFLSLLLSFVMLFSLTMPAMAAEGSTTIYFDNTAGWATVNAFAFDAENNAYLGQWPGTAMTYVEGNIWSVAFPTGATSIIFNDGTNQTADLTLPTDGSNLYTYNVGWSTYTPTGTPTINGDTSHSVTASYTPSSTEDTTAKITGVTITVDGITYDSGNVTIYSDSTVTLNVIGTNLQNGTEDHFIQFADGLGMALWEDWFEFSEDGTTGTYTGATSEYDGCSSWEIEYYNDYTAEEAVAVGTGIYLTYDSGTKPTTYTITPNFLGEGTIAAPATAAEGDTVTLTVTPAEGYMLDTLTVTDAEGNPVTVENNSFTMPASNVTITATFVEDTATETPCLTITIDGTTYTNENTSADNPALIYSNSDAVITVYGDNLAAGVSGFYGSSGILNKFYTISSDCTSATRSASSYTFSTTVYEICYTIDGTEQLSSGVYVQSENGLKPGTYYVNVNNTYDGGWVSLGGLTTAAENDLVTLTVDTDYGYELSSLTVSDGTNEIETTKVDDTTYTFTMPASDVTITPVFEEITVARVTGFKLTVDGKDYTTNEDGTAYVTADSQSVFVTLTGTDLNLMTTCTLGLYENVTFTNGEANVTVSDDGTSAVLTIDPTSFTTAFSWSITYQLEGDSLNYTGVQLSYLTDTGTDLTAIYFENSEGWETIQANFYDQNQHYDGLGTVTLTLVPGETDIYYTTEIPAYAYWVYFDNGEDLFTESREIPMAADGTDQYNPDSDTWTKFVATEQSTTSVEITWGSMSFTYIDTEDADGNELGWQKDTTDGAGTVTVTNTGDNTFTAIAEYKQETGFEEINGYFATDSATASAEISGGSSHIFTLELKGKPNKAITAGTTIGSVTITISEAAEG